MAETDALTGFFNQRYFHETLRREALRAQRYDRRLALLILDLDDFKSVNDRVGHLAGDAVLAQVAEQLRNEIRSVDIGCRVGGRRVRGGDAESTEDDASQLFERMRDGVAYDADARRPSGRAVGAGSPSSVTARRRRGCSSAPDSALRHVEGRRQGPRDERVGVAPARRRARRRRAAAASAVGAAVRLERDPTRAPGGAGSSA
jgi:GGDEF domain-containing protein